MSGGVKSEDGEAVFLEVMNFCKYYGRFATGASLFIHMTMCFTILVDSFNMHVVDHMTLLDPYSLFAILIGVYSI